MARALTEEMKRCLRHLVCGENVSVKSSTGSALIARGLVTEDHTLTPEGWMLSVGMLPLKEQCNLLNIPHEKISGLDFRGFPELAAWRYYTSLGYVGAYCEGGLVLLLIRSAALEALANLNTFESREDACTRFTEAQLEIHKAHASQLLAIIRSSNATQVASAFEEIYASPMISEWYPGITTDAVIRVFTVLGPERLAAITSAIMEAPYTYRAGWPDLTMTNGTEMLWAEVKTTDKLHHSQITTLRRMKALLPGQIRVVQLTP